MSTAEQIRNLMLDIAESRMQQMQLLEKELADIGVRKSQIEAELAALDLLKQRIASFKPVIDGTPQCPNCFVIKGTQVATKPASTAAEMEDDWRCPDCGFKFTTDA